MKAPDRTTVEHLTELPNIGPAIAAGLARIGITHPQQLIGCDAYALHAKLCAEMGEHQDNCVIDVYLAAIEYMEGGEALPWWAFSDERKRHLASQ